tara:strand:- start:1043 stop:1471 length:429 start_codon:yes stop_codon:yes gene_type:complete
MSTEDKMPAYTFIQHPYGESDIVPNVLVSHTVMDNDISLPELLEVFETFLSASGFTLKENEHLDFINFMDSPNAEIWGTKVLHSECMSCKLNLHSLEQELLCFVRYIAENAKGGSAENAIEQRDEFIEYAHKILNLIGEENV